MLLIAHVAIRARVDDCRKEKIAKSRIALAPVSKVAGRATQNLTGCWYRRSRWLLVAPPKIVLPVVAVRAGLAGFWSRHPESRWLLVAVRAGLAGFWSRHPESRWLLVASAVRAGLAGCLSHHTVSCSLLTSKVSLVVRIALFAVLVWLVGSRCLMSFSY
jgi:hypothetical protein